MKTLVITTDYPTNQNPGMLRYVHTRNLYYQKDGICVTVLNFNAQRDYVFQGIKVITYKSFVKDSQGYDILVSHAPNIRFHYRFLKSFENQFPKIVIFFHGHEVLKINKVYSPPYGYIKKNWVIKILIQDLYDKSKLFLWRKYLPRIIHKTKLVFVSKWMFDEFLKWVKIPKALLEDSYSITYNGVGEIFEKNNYVMDAEKEFDFITIRPNLDGSKYAIDIVRDLAIANPEEKFLIIGRGKFFNHFSIPKNITRIEKVLNHDEIIEYLNKSRYALMPTRTDAQGLMACEMATYGIPLVTSDIPVCHEIFDDFQHVGYIDNVIQREKELEWLCRTISNKEISIKNSKYFSNNTMSREVELFRFES